MSLSMNLTEISVNVDVNSVGKVQRQTKNIALCAIQFLHVALRCKVTKS